MKFFEILKIKVKENAHILTVVFAVCLFYFLLFMLGITCPIKFLTGISCPGCGMSRALISALTFDFSLAFYYHPLWIALPVVAVSLVFLNIKKKKKAFWLLTILSVLTMIVVYLFRLFFLESDIVTASLSDSFFSKIFQKIITFLS